MTKVTRKMRVKALAPAPLKLDFGCGPNTREGFSGVDVYPFDGKVKYVLDIRQTPWPWADGTVDEAHASHFVEHLTAVERVSFMNELWRVLKMDAKCQIIIPHWASCRAYGDPTHQWPPVSEFWFYYLSREWRAVNAPHTDQQHWKPGFNCHFEATWGYNMRPDLATMNPERQQYAVTNYKEAISDIIATLTKRP